MATASMKRIDRTPVESIESQAKALATEIVAAIDGDLIDDIAKIRGASCWFEVRPRGVRRGDTPDANGRQRRS